MRGTFIMVYCWLCGFLSFYFRLIYCHIKPIHWVFTTTRLLSNWQKGQPLFQNLWSVVQHSAVQKKPMLGNHHNDHQGIESVFFLASITFQFLESSACFRHWMSSWVIWHRKVKQQFDLWNQKGNRCKILFSWCHWPFSSHIIWKVREPCWVWLSTDRVCKGMQWRVWLGSSPAV